MAELEVYVKVEDLVRVGRALWKFPREPEEQFVWEFGSEDPGDRCAYYFRFRAFQVEPRGLCAIELRFNHNQDPPNQQISEFCIPAMPGDLDRLSGLFKEFSKLEHEVLEWTVEPGELR